MRYIADAFIYFHSIHLIWIERNELWSEIHIKLIGMGYSFRYVFFHFTIIQFFLNKQPKINYLNEMNAANARSEWNLNNNLRHAVATSERK